VPFLYTNIEKIENQYRKTITFTIASKKYLIPRRTSTKDVNDIFKENCKLLKKEIKEDYRQWKALPCS
jgi:hypothetical protein